MPSIDVFGYVASSGSLSGTQKRHGGTSLTLTVNDTGIHVHCCVDVGLVSVYILSFLHSGLTVPHSMLPWKTSLCEALVNYLAVREFRSMVALLVLPF